MDMYDPVHQDNSFPPLCVPAPPSIHIQISGSQPLQDEFAVIHTAAVHGFDRYETRFSCIEKLPTVRHSTSSGQGLLPQVVGLTTLVCLSMKRLATTGPKGQTYRGS